MTIRGDSSAGPRGPARVEVFNPPFNPQDPDASTFRWSPQIGGAAAAVDALSASAEAQRASGGMTRLCETETWLALAREDLDAAVAGVDAEQLAAMGPESVMTGPAPCCGYPGPEAPARVSAEDEGPWVTRLQAWERSTVRPETTRREPEAGS